MGPSHTSRCLIGIASMLIVMPLGAWADDVRAALDKAFRSAFEQTQLGELQNDVERSVGTPDYIWWQYDKQGRTNERRVKFEDGRMTNSITVLRQHEEQIPVEIEEGMTMKEVQALLGLPKTVCSYYALYDGWVAKVCFADSKVIAKEFVLAPHLRRIPVVHHLTSICRPIAFFASDSALLQESAKKTLSDFLQACSRAEIGSPKLSIAVRGHTDSVEARDSNFALSQARADAVRTYLISLGVPASKIDVAARGDADPLVPTNKEDPQNRRAEVDVR